MNDYVTEYRLVEITISEKESIEILSYSGGKVFRVSILPGKGIDFRKTSRLFEGRRVRRHKFHVVQQVIEVARQKRSVFPWNGVRPCFVDVFDNIRRAIIPDRVVKLRLRRKFVRPIHDVEEHHLNFLRRQTQTIKIDIVLIDVRIDSDHVPLVGDDVNQLELITNPAERVVRFADLVPGFDGNAQMPPVGKAEADLHVSDRRQAAKRNRHQIDRPQFGERIGRVKIRGRVIGRGPVSRVTDIANRDKITVASRRRLPGMVGNPIPVNLRPVFVFQCLKQRRACP